MVAAGSRLVDVFTDIESGAELYKVISLGLAGVGVASEQSDQSEEPRSWVGNLTSIDATQAGRRSWCRGAPRERLARARGVVSSGVL